MLGLAHEGHAVSQKQHVFHQSSTREHIDKRGRDAGLSRSRGHHQKTLTVALLYVGANALDSLHLVVALTAASYGLINRKRRWLRGGRATVQEPLKVVLGKDAAHRARSPRIVINKQRGEAVGEKDGRLVAKLRLQAGGVQAGLL